MNHHEVLGVGLSASVAEIRAAYLQRALELHPDKPGGNKVEFQKLVAAFEILSDASKRVSYSQLVAASRIRPAVPSSAVNLNPSCRISASKSHCHGIPVRKTSCFFDTSDHQTSWQYWGYRGMQ